MRNQFKYLFSYRIVILLILLIGYLPLLAQKGPGGVSIDTESPEQSTNRIWLDASQVTAFADQDPITQWEDVSPSGVEDSVWNVLSKAPIYRDNPAFTINGYPVITFSDNHSLLVEKSTDLLNPSGAISNITLFFAFRTSSDITTRQILWESGGTCRGYNVYIEGGEIYMGVYDNIVDDDDVPAFGYAYIHTPIAVNSTYVVTFVFDGSGAGVGTLDLTQAPLKGYLNGQQFSSIIIYDNFDSSCGVLSEDGVGQIWWSWGGDSGGIGAVNNGTVNTSGSINNITGQYPFKGRLAEICLYIQALKNVERIIVENYLESKYFVNVQSNDKYNYQSNYGHDVIGLGWLGATDYHGKSQGRNPLILSADAIAGSTQASWLLAGNNGVQMYWSDQNVPHPDYFRRLSRIWRVDNRGITQNQGLKIEVDTTMLPVISPANSPINQYVLLIDTTSQNIPNFNGANTIALELKYNSTTELYERDDLELPDGAFFTIGLVKSAVSFSIPENYAVESDPSPSNFAVNGLIEVTLNFTPYLNHVFSIPFTVSDNTAISTDDYSTQGVQSVTIGDQSFPNGIPKPFAYINDQIFITNDDIAETPNSTEDFTIALNPPTGLYIGTIPTQIFTIYDDDPDPYLSFSPPTYNVAEDNVLPPADGTDTLAIIITRGGATTDPSSATVELDNSYAQTANSPNNFEFVSQNIYFPAGVVEDTVYAVVHSDNLYDDSRSFRLKITNIQNAYPGTNILCVVNIGNTDPMPKVGFLTATSQNYEVVGLPQINVVLSEPSAKAVIIQFFIDEPAGTASNGPDYSGITVGFGELTIPAGDSIAIIPSFTVSSDDVPEDPETVVFRIPSADYADITGQIIEHTYTIKEYTPFENKGPGGVGQTSDYSIWFQGNQLLGSANNPSDNELPNSSPMNIHLYQSTVANRAEIVTLPSGQFNGRKVLKFSNDDYYYIGNSDSDEGAGDPSINLAGPYLGKALFFVIKTPANLSSSGIQVLFKQGGINNGLCIYFIDNTLYFNGIKYVAATGDNWGGSHAYPTNSPVYASQTLEANSIYAISCIYKAAYTDADGAHDGYMKMYVNGELADHNTVGSHITPLSTATGKVCLGGLVKRTSIYNGTPTREEIGLGNNSVHYSFKGWLAEFIYMNQPQMNEVRRHLVENYLSAKYNIPLNTNQWFDMSYADIAQAEYFGEEMAGIGQGANNTILHLNARGQSQVTIAYPETITNNSHFIWGHNDIPLSEIWPYSGGNMPPGVNDRSGRVWRGTKVGSISDFTVRISYNELQNANGFVNINDLKLLIHHNSNPQDFSNATVINASQYLSGNVVLFNSVDFFNNTSVDYVYFTLGNSNPLLPLPIEMLYFNASLQSNYKIIDLDWATATELNNAGFTVERAHTNLTFEPLTRVQGMGTSNTTHHYHTIDVDPKPGINYYRLKQSDYDGTCTYSDVKSVFVPNRNTGDELYIFPNPNTSYILNIRLPSDIEKQIKTVSIRSLDGKLIYSRIHSEKQNVLKIQLDDALPKGIYVITVKTDRFVDSQKLVLQ